MRDPSTRTKGYEDEGDDDMHAGGEVKSSAGRGNGGAASLERAAVLALALLSASLRRAGSTLGSTGGGLGAGSSARRGVVTSGGLAGGSALASSSTLTGGGVASSCTRASGSSIVRDGELSRTLSATRLLETKTRQ